MNWEDPGSRLTSICAVPSQVQRPVPSSPVVPTRVCRWPSSNDVAATTTRRRRWPTQSVACHHSIHWAYIRNTEYTRQTQHYVIRWTGLPCVIYWFVLVVSVVGVMEYLAPVSGTCPARLVRWRGNWGRVTIYFHVRGTRIKYRWFWDDIPVGDLSYPGFGVFDRSCVWTKITMLHILRGLWTRIPRPIILRQVAGCTGWLKCALGYVVRWTIMMPVKSCIQIKHYTGQYLH